MSERNDQEVKRDQPSIYEENRPIFTNSDVKENKKVQQEPSPDCCFIKSFCCCLTKMEI